MKLKLKLESFQGRIIELFNQKKTIYFLVFLIAFLLRLIPEIIVPNYPIGYETITYYAPAMISSNGVSNSGFFNLLNQFVILNPSLGQFLRSGPIFYVLMWFIIDLFGVDAFFLLKIVGPLLYGFLGISFYMFVRRGLKLEFKTAFLVVLILLFQPAALRLSWDRYRTVFALILFFISLVVLKKKNSNAKWVSVGLLGVLTVLSRDYIGLVFLLTVGGYTYLEKKDRFVSLLALIPAFLILLISFDLNWFSWTSISIGNQFGFTDYGWILQDIFSIIVVCYLLILPLVLKGFKKNSILNPMTAWLIVASFSVVFFPWFSIPGYQRWLMILVFPFSIYSVKGLLRLNFRKFKKPFFAVYISVLLMIGFGYSTSMFSYIGQFPNSYVPVHLVQSSIPWEQIDDVKNVLNWIDDNVEIYSTLIVEERFLGWARIYLQRDIVDITLLSYGVASSPFSLAAAIDSPGVYFIWYIDGIFSDFQVLYSKNNIALFEYVNS